MKKIYLFSLFIICMIGINKLAAQTGVAINTDGSAAAASAMLDIKTTGKGILIPRMTLALRPATPSTGLLIYQTDGTVGFYYYDGAAWIYIQNSGSTALNASNLTSGTVPLARLGVSGTTNSTTFLRGDNTWAIPSGGGGGQYFTTTLTNSVNLIANYAGLNGPNFGVSTSFSPAGKCTYFPVAGTIDGFWVQTVATGTAATSTVTLTLYKNGVATTMTCSVTQTTTGTIINASDITHPITVAAGDYITIACVTTGSTTPNISLCMTTHFQ
jgi:hypothetical protein